MPVDGCVRRSLRKFRSMVIHNQPVTRRSNRNALRLFLFCWTRHEIFGCSFCLVFVNSTTTRSILTAKDGCWLTSLKRGALSFQRWFASQMLGQHVHLTAVALAEVFSNSMKRCERIFMAALMPVCV